MGASDVIAFGGGVALGYYAAGKYPPRIPPDSVLYLDGNNSYVEVPGSSAISLPTNGALTVAARIRPDTLNFPLTEGTNNEYIQYITKGEFPDKIEWSLRMYKKKSSRPNRLSFYVFNNTGGIGTGSYVQDYINNGQWIWVIGKADNAKTYIYKDGQFRDCDVYMRGIVPPGICREYTYDVTPQAGSGRLRIGTSFNTKSYFLGAIKEFIMFPWALSDTEIKNLVNDTNKINPATRQGAMLWHRYYLGNAKDYSGKGHDGVLVGSAKFVDDISREQCKVPFIDDFNGTSLTSNWYLPPTGGVPTNTIVGGGILKLLVDQPLLDVNVYTSVHFGYGTFIYRLKLPTEDPNMAAFIALRDINSGGQINIKYYNYIPDSLTIDINNGYDSTGNNTLINSMKVSTPGIGIDFHTLRLDWLENIVTVYLDGNQIYQFSDITGIMPSVPMETRFRCRNPSWRPPVATPSSMLIDRAEYYQEYV